ncbi:hypothetical protein JSY14_00005, partial [Brachybacterium sp. EF45031]|uniref:hypothetical protein n=1 Tax=Brachybacterium sillae TaxID=2810536 RepID=UPI00217D50ED
MSTPDRPTLHPATVPALLGFLILGFVLGYGLGPWGVIGVLLLGVLGAVVAAQRPDLREPVLAAGLGLLLGFGGVMILAALYYVAG